MVDTRTGSMWTMGEGGGPSTRTVILGRKMLHGRRVWRCQQYLALLISDDAIWKFRQMAQVSPEAD